MTYKDLIKLVPTLQATALLSNNVSYLKKKKKKGKLINQGVDNLINLPLIQATSDMTF
jgi:hypothetical protein